MNEFNYGERIVKITQDHIKQAKQNGISEGLLKQRVYTRKIPTEQAATQPVNINRIKLEEVEKAAGNGICYKTLSSRINRLGWDRERAITQAPDLSRSNGRKKIS